MDKKKYSQLQALLRGGLSGATINLDDEAYGALKAMKDALMEEGKGLSDIPDIYKSARDEYRAESEDIRQQHPGTYLAGQLGGGLATIALPGAAVRAPSMGRAMLNAAGYGAAAGFGGSEKEGLELAKDIGAGALIGGAVGGISQPIAKAGMDKFAALRNMISKPSQQGIRPNIIKPEEFVEAANALKYNKDLPQAAARRIEESVQDQLGKRISIPELEKRTSDIKQAAMNRLTKDKAAAQHMDEVTNVIDDVSNTDALVKAQKQFEEEIKRKAGK